MCFRCNSIRINLTIIPVLIATVLFKVVQSVSPVTDSISSQNEITTASSVTKQFCGYLEIRDQVESHIIVNVTEGQNISPELFSVIYDKIKGAAIVLKNENCMIEICGYFTPKFNTELWDCNEFWKSETSLPDVPYLQNFKITHISCGCKKHRPNCEERTCDFYENDSASDEIKSKWPEGTCGILFQENNCQECYHDGILLEKGKVFETRNSAYIRSKYVACYLSTGYGLPYKYYYSPVTYERSAFSSPDTPLYASKDQNYYYCFNCEENRKKTRKFKNLSSTIVIPSTSIRPLVESQTSTEINLKFLPNLHTTTKTIWNVSDPNQIAESTWYSIGGVSLLLIGATCFGLLLGFRRLRKRKISKSTRMKLLTKKDIATFKKGEDINSVCGDIELTNVFNQSTEAWKLPYDKKYEIDKHHLVFGDVIAEGIFGIINEGTLLTFDKNRFKKVAIKTPKDSREYFKDVLNEIQILSYLGYHPNIVFFIGACTINLEEGKVHYVMEFCPHGSLYSYLESQKKLINPPDPHIRPSIQLTGYCETAICLPERFTKTNQELFNRMVKWSEDIASGMEFLFEKKILHIDLATRNILLDEDLTAKLADFGLSRKIYEKLSYEKSGQVPIPFKWMAIESLVSNTYTFKSDVWAYGVTLWEIFSIGSHPYLDMGFKEICSFLLSGSRLECPLYATQEIYDKILLCWNAESSSRPCFKDLKKFFKRITNDYQREVVDN